MRCRRAKVEVRRRWNIFATTRAKILINAALASENENACFPENALTPCRNPVCVQNSNHLTKLLLLRRKLSAKHPSRIDRHPAPLIHASPQRSGPRSAGLGRTPGAMRRHLLHPALPTDEGTASLGAGCWFLVYHSPGIYRKARLSRECSRQHNPARWKGDSFQPAEATGWISVAVAQETTGGLLKAHSTNRLWSERIGQWQGLKHSEFMEGRFSLIAHRDLFFQSNSCRSNPL